MYRVRSKTGKIVRIKDLNIRISRQWVYLTKDQMIKSKDIFLNREDLILQSDKSAKENKDINIENNKNIFVAKPKEESKPSKDVIAVFDVENQNKLEKKEIDKIEKEVNKVDTNEEKEEIKDKKIEVEDTDKEKKVESKNNEEINKKNDKKEINKKNNDINKLEQASKRGRPPKNEATK